MQEGLFGDGDVEGERRGGGEGQGAGGGIVGLLDFGGAGHFGGTVDVVEYKAVANFIITKKKFIR